uniref:Putative ovule protein n=1 Tax=Solanum chacoense TaxID=4108 RepID=A0A0V0HG23_SOLCH
MPGKLKQHSGCHCFSYFNCIGCRLFCKGEKEIYNSGRVYANKPNQAKEIFTSYFSSEAQVSCQGQKDSPL